MSGAVGVDVRHKFRCCQTVSTIDMQRIMSLTRSSIGQPAVLIGVHAPCIGEDMIEPCVLDSHQGVQTGHMTRRYQESVSPDGMLERHERERFLTLRHDEDQLYQKVSAGQCTSEELLTQYIVS